MRPSAPRSLLSAFWAKPLLPSSSPWSAWLSVSAWEIVEYRSYRHSRKKHKKHKDLDSFVAFAFFCGRFNLRLEKASGHPSPNRSKCHTIWGDFAPGFHGTDVLNAPKQITC